MIKYITVFGVKYCLKTQNNAHKTIATYYMKYNLQDKSVDIYSINVELHKTLKLK